ncbi:hypothetical protein [Flavobacterium pedocola]
MKNLFLAVLTVLSFSTVGFSQSQRELYNQSTEAYKAKNYPQFLKLTQKLDSLFPLHPTFTYNLVRGYSLNNEKEKAISCLQKFVLMDSKSDILYEEDFQNIYKTIEFREIEELKDKLNLRVLNSQKVISLSEKDLHPEGLIYLEKQKVWLASSIRKKKIVSFDMKTGQCSDWFTDSNLSVFAMKIDNTENFIWIATGAMREMIGFANEMAGESEILKIDLTTRKIVKRFPIGGNHIFGDLTIDNQGNVYVSDSGDAVIYRISNDVMSVWLDLKKEAFNLQGITLNLNNSKLFISDYRKGILVIDVKNPEKRHWLNFPDDATPKGIDGLVFYENSLFAIHNGVNPMRVIQYNLKRNQNSISEFRVIDNNRPEFNEPALATISKDKLYFFGNSPWSAYDKNFQLDSTKFEAPVLYQYDIKK